MIIPDIIVGPVPVDPVQAIYHPEMCVGDVVMVSENRRLYWRTITTLTELIVWPRISPAGWTFLGPDHPDAREDAWAILSGVESVEHDPSSATTGDGAPSGLSFGAVVRALMTAKEAS